MQPKPTLRAIDRPVDREFMHRSIRVESKDGDEAVQRVSLSLSGLTRLLSGCELQEKPSPRKSLPQAAKDRTVTLL